MESRGHGEGTNAEQNSILLADVENYSDLDEYELQRFFEQVLPQIASALENHGAWEQNSWGDGVIALFNSPKSAARCALDIRDLFKNEDWKQYNLPDDLSIRIALHTTTIHRGHNPIRDAEGVVGTGVNLVARIDPIIKPNRVYATKLFLENLEPQLHGNTIAYDDLFDMELAKGWGTERLVHIRRVDEQPLTPEEATVDPDQTQPGELPEDIQSMLQFLRGSDGEMQERAVEYMAKEARVEAIEPLVEVLHDREKYGGGIRTRVAARLDEFEDNRVVPPLIQAVKEDPEMSVRHDAILSLANIGDIRAFDTLVEVLEDHEGQKANVRAAAVKALFELEDERVVEPLTDAVSDPDEEVRARAIQALGELGDRRAIDAIRETLDASEETNPTIRIAAEHALRSMKGPEALDSLLEALDDPSVKVRGAAIEGIREFRGIDQPHVVEALIRATEDESVTVRKRATRTLGKTGNRESLDRLQEILTDTEGTMAEERAQAVIALRELEEAESIDTLIKATEDPSREVRIVAIRALGELKAIRALERLEEFVTNERPAIVDVRKAAAIALGDLGEPMATDSLLTATDDPAVEVQVTAIGALGDIRSPRAVDELEAILTDGDRMGEVRRAAAQSLKKIRKQDSIDELLEAVEDPDETVQQAAIEAAATIGGDRVLEKLTDVATDESEYSGSVRARAAVQLQEFDDPAVISALMSVLNDEDAPEQVKGHAAQALGKIGDPVAAERLADIVADRANPVKLRRVSIRSLGLISSPETEDVISEIIRDGQEPQTIRDQALYAIGCIGTDSSKKLLSSIAKGSNEQLAMRARQVLALGPGRIKKMLRESYADNDGEEDEEDD